MKRICGLIVLAFAALGCVVSASETSTPQEQKTGDAKGEEVTLDGLKSKTPSTWKMEKPSNNLRMFQFRVPKVGDDKEDAQVVGFSFGSSDVDENLKRWKTQFLPPKGKTIDDVSKVEKYKVGNVAVVCLDVHGTFKYKFPPNDPKAKVEPKENFRRYNVIFDTPNKMYFITMTGPAKTMEQNKASFDHWVKGFK